MWQETLALLRKDLRLEMRQKHTLAGLFMFVLSSVFVCYLSFQSVDSASTWGALLWIVGLFGAINAMSRTFFSEGQGAHIHLFTLAHPRAVILSKILFNSLLVTGLNTMALLLFLLFFGTGSIEQADLGQFAAGVVLGSLSLGISLTLMAGIAFKAANHFGLTAILAFPVLVPVLIVLVRFSVGALEGLEWGENLLNLSMLFVLLGASFALALILFPYLWRE